MENVLQYLKQLTSDESYQDSFDALVSEYFDDLLVDELTKLEQFQVIIAILLVVMKGLKELEEYTTMGEISELYTILYSKLFKTLKPKQRVLLMYSDSYYQQQIHIILNNN